jgi:hypothetical protein
VEVADGVAELVSVPVAPGVAEPLGLAEGLGLGRYLAYSGRVPSTTGTLIVAESEPLRIVTGVSPPGMTPALLRMAGSAASLR